MSDSTEYGWKPEMPLSLLEKIKQDLKKAMLNKDQEARNAMRQIMAEFPKLTVPLTLQSYLPQMVSREDIVAWIQDNVDFAQFKNKMQAMGTIMKHFGKAADGKLVNEILKDWQ